MSERPIAHELSDGAAFLPCVASAIDQIRTPRTLIVCTLSNISSRAPRLFPDICLFCRPSARFRQCTLQPLQATHLGAEANVANVRAT